MSPYTDIYKDHPEYIDMNVSGEKCFQIGKKYRCHCAKVKPSITDRSSIEGNIYTATYRDDCFNIGGRVGHLVLFREPYYRFCHPLKLISFGVCEYVHTPWIDPTFNYYLKQID